MVKKILRSYYSLIILLPFTIVCAPEVIDIYCVCIVETPQNGVQLSIYTQLHCSVTSHW